MIRHLLDSEQVLVEENFLSDPQRFMSLAKDCVFARESHSLYTGRVSSLSAEMEDMVEVGLAKLLPKSLERKPMRLRLLGKEDAGTDLAQIHVDRNVVVFLLFLSTHSSEQGTFFFKHKLKDFRRHPFDGDQRTLVIQEMLLQKHSAQRGEWEPWLTVTPEFNKVILFDGHLYHGGPAQFVGEDFAESRLTLEIFFNREQMRKEI